MFSTYLNSQKPKETIQPPESLVQEVFDLLKPRYITFLHEITNLAKQDLLKKRKQTDKVEFFTQLSSLNRLLEQTSSGAKLSKKIIVEHNGKPLVITTEPHTSYLGITFDLYDQNPENLLENNLNVLKEKINQSLTDYLNK